jgi:hypothetical protein
MACLKRFCGTYYPKHVCPLVYKYNNYQNKFLEQLPTILGGRITKLAPKDSQGGGLQFHVELTVNK